MKAPFVLLFTLLSLCGYSRDNNKINTDTSATSFWNYFQLHVETLQKLTGSKDLLVDVSQELHKYFPEIGMGYLLNYNNGKQTSKIFFTANGDKENFPTVRAIVKAAPKSIKKNVIAFNPPSYLPDSLKFDDKVISTNDIDFSYKKGKKETNITLYINFNLEKGDRQFEQALIKMLTEYLGEYEFAKIEIITILNTDSKKPGERTQKLEKLQGAVKSMHVKL
ncbi:MAG: hypothetical protein ABI772_04860 [Bacteroidota bacterium]